MLIKEISLCGPIILYYSIYLISDGYECFVSFEHSSETVRNKILQLKERIDD